MVQEGAYGLLAFAYDEATGKASLARLTALLKGVLARHAVGRPTHLDLACGTGLAVALFERLGYRSVGIDASLPMLHVAGPRVERRVAGDLRRLPLAGTFGTITLLSDTINSLCRRSDLVRCLRAIRQCMEPGSLLLFDVSTPRTLSRWPDQEVLRTRGRSHALSIEATYSQFRRRATLRFEGWAKHQGLRYSIAETHSLRAYGRGEILRSLREASLRALEVIDFRRYANNDAWLFVVGAI